MPISAAIGSPSMRTPDQLETRPRGAEVELREHAGRKSALGVFAIAQIRERASVDVQLHELAGIGAEQRAREPEGIIAGGRKSNAELDPERQLAQAERNPFEARRGVPQLAVIG